MSLWSVCGTALIIAMLVIGGFSAISAVFNEDLQESISEQIYEDPVGKGVPLAKVVAGYDNLIPSSVINIGDSEILIPHPAISDLLIIGLFFLVFWFLIHFVPQLVGRPVLDTTLLIGMLAVSYIVSKLVFYYLLFKPGLQELGFPEGFGFELSKKVSTDTAPLHFPTFVVTVVAMILIVISFRKSLKG